MGVGAGVFKLVVVLFLIPPPSSREQASSWARSLAELKGRGTMAELESLRQQAAVALCLHAGSGDFERDSLVLWRRPECDGAAAGPFAATVRRTQGFRGLQLGPSLALKGTGSHVLAACCHEVALHRVYCHASFEVREAAVLFQVSALTDRAGGDFRFCTGVRTRSLH